MYFILGIDDYDVYRFLPASRVLDAMDSNVEPCDDFYNFACGTFVKNTNIPDEKVSVNTFSVIGDLLQEQLRILVSEEPREAEAKPFALAKNFFKACMNKSNKQNVSFIEKRNLNDPFYLQP